MMIVYEYRHPRHPLPKIRGWWTRTLFLNGLQVGVILLAGVAWDRWLLRFQLFRCPLGPAFGGLVGYLALTFIYYWWHRLRHVSPFCWRIFHQMHHSPARLEVMTAFYKHPVELVADSVLSSLILYALLGLSPTAAAGAVLLSGLAELFYHWNVRTPHWVGYLFQRPEMHCIHHQRGLHHYNYSDLPLWDMLFGTYRNPKQWRGECGLGEAEQCFGEMLLGRDVWAKDQPKRSRPGSRGWR